MAALPVKEAQCKQMFSSCGRQGAETALQSSEFLHRGPTAPATSPLPLGALESLTLSVRVTSAPRVSSIRITSMCLCSAAQMMGVQPPLS